MIPVVYQIGTQTQICWLAADSLADARTLISSYLDSNLFLEVTSRDGETLLLNPRAIIEVRQGGK